jgi:hypothetical protein
MAEIGTNRDLYLAISQLIAQHEQAARPLEEYLRALWAIGTRRHSQPSLSPEEFFAALAEAFTAEAVPFDEGMRRRYTHDLSALDTLPPFSAWACFILRQIVDLREMAESGQLADKYRYFGIDSPRGSRWYNFDPCVFLECAARYSFVDGCEGESAPLSEISWELFRDFLGAGQAYE